MHVACCVWQISLHSMKSNVARLDHHMGHSHLASSSSRSRLAIANLSALTAVQCCPADVMAAVAVKKVGLVQWSLGSKAVASPFGCLQLAAVAATRRQSLLITAIVISQIKLCPWMVIITITLLHRLQEVVNMLLRTYTVCVYCQQW